MKITPISYDIHLTPDLTTFVCEGKVWFTFEAEDLLELKLDILDMEILECGLMQGQDYAPLEFVSGPKGESLTLKFPAAVQGRQQVSVSYRAQINNLMAGFYRSVYCHEGKEGVMATTQFEESDARRAFPCLDHPQYKAVFNISMDIEAKYTGLANTHVKQEMDLGNGKKRLIFESTPKMSTYLVFFGVGDFEITEDTEDPRVRTCVLPKMSDYAGIARDFGRKTLKYCEDYYGYPYGIGKMDLIAVPDFAFGAMENWGAITFRENLLYYYPGTTSKAGLERICEVIAHEIVHQWFGNLVTPVDWKYLWLNESFATYFGYAATAHYFPQWEYWDKFLTDETNIAMERDSLRETTSIEIPSENQVIIINSSTAPIIYNKGGALMLMLRDFIGEDAFKKALQTYLKKFAFECTETDDLLQIFEESTGQPLQGMLQKWITSEGFPQIKAELQDDTLTLSQQRFTFLATNTDTIWPVPLTLRLYYADGTTEDRKLVMGTPSMSFKVDQSLRAVCLNLGRVGFYRCLYSAENFIALMDLAVQKQLEHADRWGLMGDLFAAVKAGQIDFEVFEQACVLMQDEDQALALNGLTSVILESYIALDNHRNTIASFALPLFEKVLAKIGLEPAASETNATAAVRERLLWGATFMGSKRIQDFLNAKFRALQNGEKVDADIVKSVMQNAALNLGREAFNWLLQRFRSSDVEFERLNILLALGSTRDAATISEVLEFVITEVPPRNQFTTVAAMGQNPYAKDYLWPWFRDNLDRIEQFHPMLYERVVAAVITFAKSEYQAEMRAFFAKYAAEKDLAREIIKLSLEKMEIYANLRDKLA